MNTTEQDIIRQNLEAVTSNPQFIPDDEQRKLREFCQRHMVQNVATYQMLGVDV